MTKSELIKSILEDLDSTIAGFECGEIPASHLRGLMRPVFHNLELLKDKIEAEVKEKERCIVLGMTPDMLSDAVRAKIEDGYRTVGECYFEDTYFKQKMELISGGKI